MLIDHYQRFVKLILILAKWFSGISIVIHGMVYTISFRDGANIEWWYGWAGVGILAAAIAVGSAIFWYADELENRRIERYYASNGHRKADTCKKPGLIRSYLKAKHDKACPRIEFKDDEEK